MKTLRIVLAATLLIWGGQTAVVAEQVHLDTMRDHYSKQLEQTKKPLTDLGTKYGDVLWIVKTGRTVIYI